MDEANFEFNLKYRLGFIGENGNFLTNEISATKENVTAGYGHPKLLLQNELLNSEKKFIIAGTLTVVCEVSKLQACFGVRLLIQIPFFCTDYDHFQGRTSR